MTGTRTHAVIDELARDTDLLPLWEAVHARLCTGAEPARLASITVAGLPVGGIAVLRTWLDTSTRRRRGTSAVAVDGEHTRVPVRALLAHFDLHAGHLAAISVAAVGKPIVDRAEARRAGTAVRERLWAGVESDLATVPALARRIRAGGVTEIAIEALAEQARHISAALATIDARHAEAAPLTLAKLAHDCARDPHAFDLDTLTGKRLVEAVAELLDEPAPARPDHIRALLARAGVLADRLSSSVLVLNLAATGPGPVDQRLRLGDGPVPLTLYDLTVHPPVFAPRPLLVVENPSVLEAALARGFLDPIACTSGHLRAVDHAFLQRAVDCRVPLSYAGDLDRDGLIIAERIRDLYQARIVAMDTEIVRQARHRPSAVTLGPLPDTTPAELSRALSEAGTAVFQEDDAILDHLLHQADSVTRPESNQAIGYPLP